MHTPVNRSVGGSRLTPMARLSGSTGQASQMTVGQEIVITRCLSSAANVGHTLPHDSFTPSIFTVGMCTGYKFSPLRGSVDSPQYSGYVPPMPYPKLCSASSLALSLSLCACVSVLRPCSQRCIAVQPSNKVLVAQSNVLDRIAAVRKGRGGEGRGDVCF